MIQSLSAKMRDRVAMQFRAQLLTKLDPRIVVALRTVRFKLFATPTTRATWRRRIALVLACPDSDTIARVSNAGTIVGGYQIMHNGLQVLAGGYYGAPIREMLSRSRGVHEPQEERVFAEILRFVPEGGTMLELGAYWGFYSMWSARVVRGARCVMVEPDLIHTHLFASTTCCTMALRRQWSAPISDVLTASPATVWRSILSITSSTATASSD